jgi:hypothetical protein
LLDEEALSGEMNLSGVSKISAEKFGTFINNEGSDSGYSHFQPLLDSLEYVPSKLENVPDIVITEGVYDWYVFSFFNEIILKNEKIKFYPGKGAGHLDDIIRLYLCWGRNFIVLLDGDAEGETQKKRYIDIFGDVLSKKIFTLTDIDTSFSTPEKLFTLNDFKELGTTGKKKELYVRIIEKYSQKEVVEFENETTDKFKQIEDFIIQKLK